jgi:uncharacterized protein YjbI with pentapeptide repeats
MRNKSKANRNKPAMDSTELQKRYNLGERDFSGYFVSLVSYYKEGKSLLANVNLSNANLSNCRIHGNLSNSDFSNSNLANAYITHTNLSNANFSNADLSNAEFLDVNFSHANLRGVNLSHAKFIRYINDKGFNLVSADLTGAILGNANLEQADLSNADLREVDLTNVNLTGAILKGTKIENYILLPPKIYLVWYLVNIGAKGRSLSKADLKNANLIGANLQEADLSNANFSGSVLAEANLEGANLNGTNFEKADLTNANLSTTQLTKTIFYDANLTKTNFHGTDLGQSLFNLASLKNAINIPHLFLETAKQRTPLVEVLDRIYHYHLKYNRKVASCLQPGLIRQEIDELLEDVPHIIPEELYQLYGWRNGMKKQGVQNYSFLNFADSRGFLPLEEVVKGYKYRDQNNFRGHYRYLENKLMLFPPATDIDIAYVVELGDEELAPVRNYDTEHNDYSQKYESIFRMMNQSFNWSRKDKSKNSY